MLFIVEMLVIGAAVGLISGALGLGGGIIMVPAFLFFIDGMDAHTVKGTSLMVILFVAAVNAWQLNRGTGCVPWQTASRLATGAIAGSYLGAWITALLPELAVILIFVTLLLLVAWQLIHHASRPEVELARRPWWLSSALIGGYSGLVGGATGTGGGLILVPLTLQTGITNNRNATGLSNLVMVAIAAAGSAAHLSAPSTCALAWTVGQVNLYAVPWVFAGAQAGSHAGRLLNHRLSLRWRRIILGVLLLVIVASVLYRAWQ